MWWLRVEMSVACGERTEQPMDLWNETTNG